jgi:hypothetical protein
LPDFHLSELSTILEGLIAVEKDGKCGFADTSGNIVVPLEYDFVMGFNEGYAWVQKDGKWGILHNTAYDKAAAQALLTSVYPVY